MQLCSFQPEIEMFEDKDNIVMLGSIIAFVAAIVIVIDVVALFDAAVTFIKVAP